jgi:type III secretion protein U
MAAKNDGGDKTEKPTRKRLRDARKEGDVAKSKELTGTVLIGFWLISFWLLGPLLRDRLRALFQLSLDSVSKPFSEVVGALGWASFQALLTLTLALLLVAVGVALIVEFLQVGPVFAPKKVKPDANRLNPAEGIKRMFSLDNVVEVVKAVVKTTALVGIVLLVVFQQLGLWLKLPLASLGTLGEAYWQACTQVGIWVIGVFLFISFLDNIYQRFSHVKKLRMSRRDIKRELKDEEGDPYVKGRRRQLHQEWATRNLAQAARSASVLVTNPTHIAIALRYEPEETVVPLVTAKGEDDVAQLMREAAEEAGVPIMRNVDLARGLHERAEIDEFVPVEFFEAVAEVLRWADSIREPRESD